MGFLESMLGGATELGFDWLGNELIGKPNADRTWERQKKAYGSRYQVTMADMRAAGLNPIIAAGSGGFNVGQGPTVVQPVAPDVGANSAYASKMEGDLTAQKEKTEQVEQLKKLAETKTELWRKFQVRADTGKASEEERRVWFEIEKLQADTIKSLKEGFKSEAEKKLIEKKMQQLNVELTRLKNVHDIYSNPASMALSIIREIANSLGLNIGVIMKGK